MPLIAIIGAGPIGGAIAHTLAGRSRVRQIRLIDTNGTIAQGKALDILQSGPVEGFSTTLAGVESVHAAAGADVVVIADSAAGDGEHGGEAGLALVRKVIASGVSSPIVFAGGSQRELMNRTITELHVPALRVVGSAPLALESGLRALAVVTSDTSPVEIQLSVVGVPPRHAVVAWEEATVSGQPLSATMAAHEIAALAARIPQLWPPGPYALGSAAARVVEALCIGSRRRFSCFVEIGRGRIVAMPVELQAGGVRRIIQPELTRLERTALENAFEV